MQSQDPDQQRNLLIAIVLSMAVLLGWQLFYAGPKVKDEQARQRTLQEQSQTAPAPDGTTPSAATAPEGTVPGATTISPPVETREQAIDSSPRLPVVTPSLKGSIALKSGRIDDLVLLKYHETVDPTSPNVVLLSPSNSPHPYFAEYGWLPQAGTSQKVPDKDTLWSVEGSPTLTPSSPVTLTWDNGQGLVFRRTISIDDEYMIKLIDAVENNSGAEVTLAPTPASIATGRPRCRVTGSCTKV